MDRKIIWHGPLNKEGPQGLEEPRGGVARRPDHNSPGDADSGARRREAPVQTAPRLALEGGEFTWAGVGGTGLTEADTLGLLLRAEGCTDQ